MSVGLRIPNERELKETLKYFKSLKVSGIVNINSMNRLENMILFTGYLIKTRGDFEGSIELMNKELVDERQEKGISRYTYLGYLNRIKSVSSSRFKEYLNSGA